MTIKVIPTVQSGKPTIGIAPSNPITIEQLGSFINSLGNSHLKRLWQPVNFTSEAIELICEGIPESAKCERRLFVFLATTRNPLDRYSTHCHNKASISNLSDVATDLNGHIRQYGLYAACNYPTRIGLPRRCNQFGEKSNDYIWSLFQMPTAANDSQYNQD